jgi:hypothetical protein
MVLPPVPKKEPVEEALFQFILNEATKRKSFEETNSTTFGVLVSEQGDNLLKFAVDRKMLSVGPGSNGVIRPEPTTARTKFERLMKVFSQVQLDALSVLTPLTTKPDLKNSSDVNPDSDLVLMRYETTGATDHQLDATTLQALVESARMVPGTLERVASSLKGEGVRWEPMVRNELNTSIQLENVEAKWSAVIDVRRMAELMTDLLSAVQVDPAKTQSPWWPSAQADVGVPNAVLPVIRSGVLYTLMSREDANAVESWAATLPGWFEDQPLIIRDVTTEEVLGQNSEDGMSNNKLEAKLAEIQKLMDKKVSAAAKKPQHAVEKVGSKWRIRSMKDGKLWPQTYDTKQMANKGLAAYHINKKTKAAAEVTDEQISDLMDEATMAGDEAQVVMCQEALNGNDVARAECAKAIDNAKASASAEKCEDCGEETYNGKCPSCGCESTAVAAAAKKLTKADVLAKLKAGESLSTEMLPALGMTMEHFLRFAQLNDAQADKVLAAIIAKLEAGAKASASAVSATGYDPHNKQHLRKIQRVVNYGHLTPEELAGGVVEALRLAKVSSRMAQAIANAVKQAVTDGEMVDSVSASTRPMTQAEKEAEAALRKARRDVFSDDPEVASAAEAEIERAKSILRPYWSERAGDASRAAGDRKMRLWE